MLRRLVLVTVILGASSFGCGGLREQVNLAKLLEGQLLLAHQRGDDQQAIQSVRDLLMISRAVEFRLVG